MRRGLPGPALSMAGLLLLLGCQGAAGGQTATPVPAVAQASLAATPDAGCRVDADCVLERRPAGGCCETLCEPRAATIAEHAALDARCDSQPRGCAAPACAPSRTIANPACVSGRCTIRQESNQ